MGERLFVGDKVFVKKNWLSNDGDYGKIIAVDDKPVEGKPCETIFYKVEFEDGKIALCGSRLVVPAHGIDGLISRKELLDMLDKDPREAFTKHNVWTMIVYGLREVDPITKAEWRINSDGYYPYCSNCNTEPESGKMTDYCPNCGAYMKTINEDVMTELVDKEITVTKD